MGRVSECDLHSRRRRTRCYLRRCLLVTPAAMTWRMRPLRPRASPHSRVGERPSWLARLASYLGHHLQQRIGFDWKTEGPRRGRGQNLPSATIRFWSGRNQARKMPALPSTPKDNSGRRGIVPSLPSFAAASVKTSRATFQPSDVPHIAAPFLPRFFAPRLRPT